MTSTSGYQNILVAIDFHHEPETIVRKAVALAESGSAIKLVHCVPAVEELYIHAYDLAGVPMVANYQNLHDEMMTESNDRLSKLIEAYPNQKFQTETLAGHTVDNIIEAEEAFNADLIVLGSHGKRGLKLLLGSTANGVLHKAACDTLMMRV